jgi:hypothetical protein
MILIKFEIEASTLGYLRDLFEACYREMDGASFVPLPETIEDDPVLRESWLDDLRRAEGDDNRILLEKVFCSTEPGDLRLTEEEGEAVLRAGTLVRLEIQSRYLSQVPEEALENGELDLAGLDAEARKAFGLYLFLGGLQAIILQNLLAE